MSYDWYSAPPSQTAYLRLAPVECDMRPSMDARDAIGSEARGLLLDLR
jgi:hypothetical protein